MTPVSFRLSDDEVRVFLAVPARLAAAARAVDVLSDADREHVARFVFERDRTVALASRALQRIALSRCSDVLPEAWTFGGDRLSKPFIATPLLERPLEFSVANAVGLVACAVSLGRPVGIDVEPIRDDVLVDVVDRCWTPRERKLLESDLSPARLRCFAQTWTAKESYVKARGLGLSLNLLDVDIDLDVDPPRIDVAERSGNDGAEWRMYSWFPLETHAACLCVHHEGRDIRLTHHWIVDV